jgi:hypothetical protein
MSPPKSLSLALAPSNPSLHLHVLCISTCGPWSSARSRGCRPSCSGLSLAIPADKSDAHLLDVPRQESDQSTAKNWMACPERWSCHPSVLQVRPYPPGYPIQPRFTHARREIQMGPMPRTAGSYPGFSSIACILRGEPGVQGSALHPVDLGVTSDAGDDAGGRLVDKWHSLQDS